MDQEYQFTAQLDADNNVTDIYSTLPGLGQTPPPGCVVYNDNLTGGHARLPDGSVDLATNGICLWRWDGSTLVRKAEEEIEAEREAQRLAQLRSAKLAEISAACETVIFAGVDVSTSLGIFHFSLEQHDQTELMALKTQLDALVAAGNFTTEAIPYHADGELCRFWNAADFGAILGAATAHIFTQRTYCNHLLVWARQASDEELEGIAYGVPLPDDLQVNMNSIIATASGGVGA